VGWPRKRKIEKMWEKLRNRYIALPCGGAISQPICIKFSDFVDFTGVITTVKFGSNILWLFQAKRWKFAISLQKSNGLYNSATALACHENNDIIVGVF